MEEAQFCMDLLQDYSITYPIVFDWEPYDSSLHPRTEGLSDEMLTKCAVAFCQAVEANGYDSMVYSNLTYFYLHYDLSKLCLLYTSGRLTVSTIPSARPARP